MSQADSRNTTIPRVVSLPDRRARPHNRRTLKALGRQSDAAIAIGGVGVTLVTLSLNHLAHGIELVTGAPTWEAWAMAIGIDLGFVALEGVAVGGHGREGPSADRPLGAARHPRNRDRLSPTAIPRRDACR
jgi:hypothetical protein